VFVIGILVHASWSVDELGGVHVHGRGELLLRRFSPARSTGSKCNSSIVGGRRHTSIFVHSATSGGILVLARPITVSVDWHCEIVVTDGHRGLTLVHTTGRKEFLIILFVETDCCLVALPVLFNLLRSKFRDIGLARSILNIGILGRLGLLSF
jgi:hypothetical protein